MINLVTIYTHTRLPSHDWVVYKVGVLLGSLGHKVKINKITPVTGKERGDIEINDYVSSYLVDRTTTFLLTH